LIPKSELKINVHPARALCAINDLRRMRPQLHIRLHPCPSADMRKACRPKRDRIRIHVRTSLVNH